MLCLEGSLCHRAVILMQPAGCCIAKSFRYLFYLAREASAKLFYPGSTALVFTIGGGDALRMIP